MTALNPHAAAASVIDRLPQDVRTRRRRKGLSLRTAATQMGLSYHAVWILERGHDCKMSTVLAALDWLADGAK